MNAPFPPRCALGRLVPIPTTTETELHAMRRRAWREQGVVTLSISTIDDPGCSRRSSMKPSAFTARPRWGCNDPGEAQSSPPRRKQRPLKRNQAQPTTRQVTEFDPNGDRDHAPSHSRHAAFDAGGWQHHGRHARCRSRLPGRRSPLACFKINATR